jgi:group I intron endonuclease
MKGDIQMKGRNSEDKRFIVYMHENKIDGKKYIGITSKRPEVRWGKNGNGYNKNSNRHFWNAIKKYGWDNFEHKILLEDLSLSDALKHEFKVSKEYNTTNPEHGYNGLVGRGGNFAVSNEIRLKYSKATQGENNPMYGKKHSEETIKKLKEVNTKNAMYGKENPASKAVKGINVNDNSEIIFESANQAAIHFNLFNNGHIIECCRGKRKTCKGYRWEYI